MADGPPKMLSAYTRLDVLPASFPEDCCHDCVVDGHMSKQRWRVFCAAECGGLSRDPGSGPGRTGLPIYGNYCGPGCGEGNGSPIDAVDAAWRAHDDCCEARSYFDCGCDRNLLNSLPGASAEPPSGAGRVAETAMPAYFSRSPRTCLIPVCLPFGACDLYPFRRGKRERALLTTSER